MNNNLVSIFESGDCSEALEYIIAQDQADWYEAAKRVTTASSENMTELINDRDHLLYFSLDHFKKDYIGKYNLDDFVTTIFGGIYKVIGLQGLDSRNREWMKNFSGESYITQIPFYILYQNESYHLAGFDKDGKFRMTEGSDLIDTSEINYNIDLPFYYSYEYNLSPITPSKEYRDIINSTINNFLHSY